MLRAYTFTANLCHPVHERLDAFLLEQKDLWNAAWEDRTSTRQVRETRAGNDIIHGGAGLGRWAVWGRGRAGEVRRPEEVGGPVVGEPLDDAVEGGQSHIAACFQSFVKFAVAAAFDADVRRRQGGELGQAIYKVCDIYGIHRGIICEKTHKSRFFHIQKSDYLSIYFRSMVKIPYMDATGLKRLIAESGSSDRQISFWNWGATGGLRRRWRRLLSIMSGTMNMGGDTSSRRLRSAGPSCSRWKTPLSRVVSGLGWEVLPARENAKRD